MKSYRSIIFGMLALILAGLISGCERQKVVCPQAVGTAQPKPTLAELINLPMPRDNSLEPTVVQIGGKPMRVDKVVDYPLCNDRWSGEIYVSCDAQVAEAETDADENPLFLKGCNLEIAPNTVVYVAAHNDAAYYRGCSCHTGEDPLP